MLSKHFQLDKEDMEEFERIVNKLVTIKLIKKI